MRRAGCWPACDAINSIGSIMNMQNEEQIWNLVDAKEAFIALSDRVFETPETSITNMLLWLSMCRPARARFYVSEGIVVCRGDGRGGTEPVIAILGEFDALPA